MYFWKSKLRKKRVLIGSLTEDNYSPITTITRAFISSEVLNKKYEFIPHYAIRKYGKAHTGEFNLVNLWYLIKHFVSWCKKIIIYRPDIAHYPITSYWNLEKSLLFLKIAGILGAKKVGQLHGGAFIDFWNKIGKIRRENNLKELNKLDVLIVSSSYWERMLREQCGIKTKIEIVPNPINRIFESKAIKFNKHNGKTILYVGRIDIRKGVLDIIESANLVLNSIECRFLLVGGVQKKDDLNKSKNLIKKYKLENEVNITSQIAEETKIELFKEALIFLLPSYTENFPLVIIEAAAAGLPIIATPVGALPEFFKHNESIIFIEPGNVNQIAKAIEDLINDESKRERLARGAREVFLSKLSRNEIMFSLDKVYQKALVE